MSSNPYIYENQDLNETQYGGVFDKPPTPIRASRYDRNTVKKAVKTTNQ